MLYRCLYIWCRQESGRKAFECISQNVNNSFNRWLVSILNKAVYAAVEFGRLRNVSLSVGQLSSQLATQSATTFLSTMEPRRSLHTDTQWRAWAKPPATAVMVLLGSWFDFSDILQWSGFQTVSRLQKLPNPLTNMYESMFKWAWVWERDQIYTAWLLIH